MSHIARRGIPSLETRVYLPNFRLILMPNGYTPNAMNRKLVFKCERNVTKPEIRNFLRDVSHAIAFILLCVCALFLRPRARRAGLVARCHATTTMRSKRGDCERLLWCFCVQTIG